MFMKALFEVVYGINMDGCNYYDSIMGVRPDMDVEYVGFSQYGCNLLIIGGVQQSKMGPKCGRGHHIFLYLCGIWAG